MTQSLKALADALEAQYRLESSSLLRRLRDSTNARSGAVYETGEPAYYIPVPGEEYWYVGIKHIPPTSFTAEGPLRKDMYGLMRVFRPRGSRDPVPAADMFARMRRLIEELGSELTESRFAGG